MRFFCTYFDSRFLPRALAMIRSLRHSGAEFRLWALCMDEAGYAALTALDLPEVTPISLSEFEREDPELVRARGDRSRLEYYFTCTPSLPLYVLDQREEVDLITYLDADLYFFSNPEPLFQELGEASIGIIAHGFAPRCRDREAFGAYNVGWVSFRRDEQGLACLRRWRGQCLEWCHARLEAGKYADQRYLDEWPERYSNLRVLTHPGANLGPWNLAVHRITHQAGAVRVDGAPLLFYHFSSFLRVAPWLYNTNLASWRVRPNTVVRRRVIGRYIAELEQIAVPAAGPDSAPAVPRERAGEGLRGVLKRKAAAVLRILSGLVLQDHLVVVRRQVL